jgi:hypothetical protein
MAAVTETTRKKARVATRRDHGTLRAKGACRFPGVQTMRANLAEPHHSFMRWKARRGFLVAVLLCGCGGSFPSSPRSNEGGDATAGDLGCAGGADRCDSGADGPPGSGNGGGSAPEAAGDPADVEATAPRDDARLGASGDATTSDFEASAPKEGDATLDSSGDATTWADHTAPLDGSPQAEGGNTDSTARAPTCVTGGDCPSGKICVSRSSCAPLPGAPCAPSSACVDNPCVAGLTAAYCGVCEYTLCVGYSGCSVTPDASTIHCLGGG